MLWGFIFTLLTSFLVAVRSVKPVTLTQIPEQTHKSTTAANSEGSGDSALYTPTHAVARISCSWSKAGAKKARMSDIQVRIRVLDGKQRVDPSGTKRSQEVKQEISHGQSKRRFWGPEGK